MVALNKIDLPNVNSSANINKIYGELSQQGLNPVEWGGDTDDRQDLGDDRPGHPRAARRPSSRSPS